MISRRNIRVKVMQTLYSAEMFEKLTKNGEPYKILKQHFDQSRSLLIFLAWSLSEIARYAEKEAHTRAGKHLPSEADLNVNIKLAGNLVLWKMLEDEALREQFKKEKPELKSDASIIKKTYQELSEKPKYKAYINASSREKADERKMLEYILNDLILANESFVSYIEENFSNWDDDGEMVVQILVQYIQKPGTINFNEMMSADKASFAKQLLETVIDKNEHLQEIITPKLKNWDPDRIAVLDMVLMKMGVAEFLYFETIPPKVSINEYIDLAKEYSTPQSGHFVNGILDNIHKELLQSGKMDKVDYKKS